MEKIELFQAIEVSPKAEIIELEVQRRTLERNQRQRVGTSWTTPEMEKIASRIEHLQQLSSMIDLSRDAFKYQQWKEKNDERARWLNKWSPSVFMLFAVWFAVWPRDWLLLIPFAAMIVAFFTPEAERKPAVNDKAQNIQDSRINFFAALADEIAAWNADVPVLNSLVTMANAGSIPPARIQEKIEEARERYKRLQDRITLARYQAENYGPLGECHASMDLTPERLLTQDDLVDEDLRGGLSVPREPLYVKKSEEEP